MFPVIILRTCLGNPEYDPWLSSRNARKRVLIMARAITEESRHRVNRMKPFRFMYEESPYYEAGYVFGEIMERYRKMVEIIKKVRNIEDIFFHTLYHLDTAQSMYFEIFHLVGMMHEIPRKWADDPQFADLRFYHDTGTKPEDTGETPEEQWDRWKNLLDIYKERKRQRKQEMKMWRKHRQLEEIYKQYETSLSERKPKNDRWPMDYGFEMPTGKNKWKGAW
ncbi:uncharacterized protein LOC126379595 [Pectinophora gossypiella]|uniref:uncharacterized protein LOC126379595 n=1 Tax=Pectinophora gossypiella TaxID=13191 RepID=UPI00214EA9AA|nr:uncharacterized protein LOC126379595 [Pectinophora gossypiella]